jgi:hypothetical protein
VIRGGQHVHVVEVWGNRECADQLRTVDEHDRPHRTRNRADRRDVGAVTGRRLHTAECHDPRARIHALFDVYGVQATPTERHLANVIALALELTPGEVIRAVLPLTDDDVLTRRRGIQLSCDKSSRRRDRRDEGHINRVGADDSRGEHSCIVRRLLPECEVQAARDPRVDDTVVGPRQVLAGESDSGGVEVGTVRCGRERSTRLPDVSLRFGRLPLGHDATVRASQERTWAGQAGEPPGTCRQEDAPSQEGARLNSEEGDEATGTQQPDRLP